MNAKQLAAVRAVNFIENGMIVGLGTGRTAAFAIEAISEKIKRGLSIKAVASSLRSEELAKKAGIILIPFSDVQAIDIYIDGADEVDRHRNLIKGGGGALLREKILAFNARQFIVIVDSLKLVNKLGKFPLPVEVVSFAWELTVRHLEKLGCAASLRKEKNRTYSSDNGNYIIDCSFNEIENVNELNHFIHSIPGVVENGLFLKNMVSKIIVGYETGKVEVIDRNQ